MEMISVLVKEPNSKVYYFKTPISDKIISDLINLKKKGFKFKANFINKKIDRF